MTFLKKITVIACITSFTIGILASCFQKTNGLENEGEVAPAPQKNSEINKRIFDALQKNGTLNICIQAAKSETRYDLKIVVTGTLEEWLKKSFTNLTLNIITTEICVDNKNYYDLLVYLPETRFISSNMLDETGFRRPRITCSREKGRAHCITKDIRVVAIKTTANGQTNIILSPFVNWVGVQYEGKKLSFKLNGDLAYEALKDAFSNATIPEEWSILFTPSLELVGAFTRIFGEQLGGLEMASDEIRYAQISTLQDCQPNESSLKRLKKGWAEGQRLEGLRIKADVGSEQHLNSGVNH